MTFRLQWAQSNKFLSAKRPGDQSTSAQCCNIVSIWSSSAQKSSKTWTYWGRLRGGKSSCLVQDNIYSSSGSENWVCSLTKKGRWRGDITTAYICLIRGRTMEPESPRRSLVTGQETKKASWKLGNWDDILGFFTCFWFTMTVLKHWNTAQKGAGITIPGGVQDQTGQSPEESLFWADVRLDDLWTFHSAWKGIEKRMKAKKRSKSYISFIIYQHHRDNLEAGWGLWLLLTSEVKFSHTGKGRVTGFAAIE